MTKEFNVIIERDEEGYYVASVPELQGCHTQAKSLMTFSRRDSGYALVLVWSFVGIAVKQAAEPLVANSAWVAALVALGLAIFSSVQRRRASGNNVRIGE